MKLLLLILGVFLVGIIGLSCTVWDIYPTAHGRSPDCVNYPKDQGCPDAPQPPVTYTPMLTWTKVTTTARGYDEAGGRMVDSPFVVYRSGDGRWQIEPESTSGPASPGVQPDGTGWCLLDLRDRPSGYLRCGTVEQMKMRAERTKAGK